MEWHLCSGSRRTRATVETDAPVIAAIFVIDISPHLIPDNIYLYSIFYYSGQDTACQGK